jgi:hypothetical protein
LYTFFYLSKRFLFIAPCLFLSVIQIVHANNFSDVETNSGSGVHADGLEKLPDLYRKQPLENLMTRIPLEDTAPVSDRTVKYAVDRLYHFERTGPTLNDGQVASMEAFVNSYHDIAAKQLTGADMVDMPEAVSTAAREVVETLPRMKAPLYYPMVVSRRQNYAFMRPGKILQFENEMTVMPSHFLNTEYQYNLLASQKSTKEKIVLIKVESDKTYPITRFSDQPENVDFILDQKNSLFEVSSVADFEYGLYDTMISVTAKPATPVRQAKAINVSNHRLKLSKSQLKQLNRRLACAIQ